MHRIRTAALGAVLTLALFTSGGVAAQAQDGSPAAPDGTFSDLGQPITSLTIHQSAVGKNAAGEPVVYGVVAGTDAPLNVVNLLTGELEATVPLPGASGAWGITVTDDGLVYLGSYNTGRLYVYSPTTGEVTDLGRATSSAQLLYGLSSAPDGTVYGGTYPNAHAFRYDPVSGEFTDFGSMAPDEAYARSTAYDPVSETLYVGAATNPRIYRIDPFTGTKTDVTPDGLKGQQSKSPYYMTYGDGKIYVNVENTLWILDAATGAAITPTLVDGTAAPSYPLSGLVSPAQDGAVYFTTFVGSQRSLVRLDTTTDVLTPLTNPDGSPANVSDPGIGYGWADVDGSPVLFGKMGNYGGVGIAYDPATQTLTPRTLAFEPIPSRLQNVSVRPDTGDVFVNAYLNGSTAILDIDAGTNARTLQLGQTEDWTWHDGKLYAGTYPNGSLVEYTPATETSAATSTTLFSLKAEYAQNRPRAVVVTDDHIYVGTTPDYGLYGGALTVYNRADKTFTVNRNVVQDQTVGSLVVADGVLYGGSSVEGGESTSPIATEAKLFTWDPAGDTKTGEYTIVPGARAINGLGVGPDGNIWGMADGTLFSFDPASHTVLTRISVAPGFTTSGDGYLRWHPNGFAYVSVRGSLYAIDPGSAEVTPIREGGVNRLVLAPSGTMYMLMKPVGSNFLMNLASFTPGPTATPQKPWDAAATYVAGDVVTHDGTTFRALWWTHGETPGASSYGAWSQVGNESTCQGSTVPEWAASTVFTGGEQINHDGHLWQAKWWTRAQVPGDEHGPWEDLGTC